MSKRKQGTIYMQDTKAPSSRRTFMQCSGGHVSEVQWRLAEPGARVWECKVCGLMNRVHTNDACQFIAFWHEHLGHQPVHIDSWKTYRRELEKIGGHNELAS